MCVALENSHTSAVGNKGMLFLCLVTSILNTFFQIGFQKKRNGSDN